MLRKMLFLVVTLLLCSGTIAFATPKQPAIIGEHNIGGLQNIGVLSCTAENVQMAIYGDPGTLGALVLFSSDVAKVAVVLTSETREQYVSESPGVWKMLENEEFYAPDSPQVSLIKAYQLCKQRMHM